MFDAGIIWIILITVWLVIIVPLLFSSAFGLQAKNGNLNWKVFLIASPLIITSIPSYLTLAFHEQSQGLMTVSALFIIPLIYLFIKEKKKRRLFLKVFFLTSFVMVMINPNIIRLWTYEYVMNDTFEGIKTSLVAKRCKKTGRSKKSQDMFVLDDGRMLRGSFKFKSSGPGYRLIIHEHDSSPFHYKVVAEKPRVRKRKSAQFNLDLVKIKSNLRETYTVGHAYNIYEKNEVAGEYAELAKKNTIVEGVGIRGIRIWKSTKDDVIEAFGNDYKEIKREWNSWIIYEQLDITFNVSHSYKDPEDKVSQISFGPNFKGKTTKRIGTNISTMQDIFKAYGEAPLYSVGSGNGKTYWATHDYTDFHVEKDKSLPWNSDNKDFYKKKKIIKIQINKNRVPACF